MKCKQMKLTTVHLCDLLYSSLFLWCIVYSMFMYSCISSIFGIPEGLIIRMIKVYCISAIVFKVMREGLVYRRKQAFALIFISVLVGGICFLSKTDDILWTWLFILGSRNTSRKKVVETVMWAHLISFVVVVGMCVFGKIDNRTFNATTDITRIRHSYGFTHPNLMGITILIVCICLLYLHFDKFKVKDYLVFAVAEYILYTVCYSRTSAALLIIMLVLTWFSKLIIAGRIKYILNPILWGTICVSVTASIYCAICYNPRNVFMFLLDTIFSKRLSFANNYLNEYGFSILGQEIEQISSLEASALGVTAKILDNAYMHIFINYGLIIGIILFFGYTKLVARSIRTNDYKTIICICIFFIWGVSEKYLYMPSYNFTLIFLGGILFDEFKDITEGERLRYEHERQLC